MRVSSVEALIERRQKISLQWRRLKPFLFENIDSSSNIQRAWSFC